LTTNTSDSADDGGEKDFGISDYWIADNVAFNALFSRRVANVFFNIF